MKNNKTKLKAHLVGLVKGGANIYETQAQIAREIRESPASVFKGGGNIGHDSSRPETEQEKLKELVRIDAYIGRLVPESPFEDMFGQLEEMERLKTFKKSRESAGIYSQSSYLEDKIVQIRNGLESKCVEFDVNNLCDVAISRSDVEYENLFVEEGTKEASKLKGGNLKSATNAINNLVEIYRRQQTQSRQNEENISYGRSH